MPGFNSKSTEMIAHGPWCDEDFSMQFWNMAKSRELTKKYTEDIASNEQEKYIQPSGRNLKL